MAIECVIYKGHREADTYLYVPLADDGETADLERVPEELLALIGRLEEVMRLCLDEQRRLAQADVRQVMADLVAKGYYLQLPPEPAAIVQPRRHGLAS